MLNNKRRYLYLGFILFVLIILILPVCAFGNIRHDPNVSRTATYTVAAYNAPEWVKTQSDIVCNGNYDYEYIMKAYDIVAQYKGNLVLSGGYFILNRPLYFDESNVSIKGWGEVNTILQVNDKSTAEIVSDVDIGQLEVEVVDGSIFSAGQDIRIGKPATSLRSECEGNIISSINGNILTMIYPLNNDYRVSDKCRVDTINRGIIIKNCHNVEISDLTIDQNSINQIPFNESPDGRNWWDDNGLLHFDGVSDTKVHDVRLIGSLCNGFHSMNCANVEVARCISERNRGNGFNTGTSRSEWVNYSYCISRNDVDDGFEHDGYSFGDIVYCKVFNAGDIGISGARTDHNEPACDISFNYVESAGNFGITISNSGARVIGNRLKDTWGIVLRPYDGAGAETGDVSGVTISENYIEDNKNGNGWAITINPLRRESPLKEYEVIDFILSNNTIINAPSKGIYVVGETPTCTIKHGSIFNNTLDVNGNVGLWIGNYANDIDVIYNKLRGTQYYAIRITNSSDIKVKDNDISEFENYAIREEHTDDYEPYGVVIENNDIWSKGK